METITEKDSKMFQNTWIGFGNDALESMENRKLYGGHGW